MADDDAVVKLDPDAWNAIVKEVIATEGVARMGRVADACNTALDQQWAGGYMVSVEGPRPLARHDYRATCITANWGAIVDNAKTNRLVQNFHLAGGD